MSISDAASVIVAAIAVVISAGSLVLTNRSRRDAREARQEALDEAQRGNSLGATVDLFREYRSDQMRRDRRIVRETLRAEPPPSSGITDFPEPADGAAFRLCHYLDHLGVLVAHGLSRWSW